MPKRACRDCGRTGLFLTLSASQNNAAWRLANMCSTDKNIQLYESSKEN